MNYYVIAVDYYMYDEIKDREYTEKCYLYTQGKHKIYVFHETLDAKDNLVSFKTAEDAHKYITAHGLNESICYENVRVECVR